MNNYRRLLPAFKMLDLAIFLVSLTDMVSDKAISKKGGYSNIPFKSPVVAVYLTLGGS